MVPDATRPTDGGGVPLGRNPAVVVGLEANGLGVVRALARHAIPCIGIGTPQWDAAYATRHCTVHRCAQWSGDGLVDALVSVGKTLGGKTPLLITKDEPVLWVSEHRELLSPYYEINLPGPETVSLLMSKISFGERARREGWPMPGTRFVRDRRDLLDGMAGVRFPCILKPAVKNSAFRARAPAKAFRASGEEELLAAYDAIADLEQEAVVQEWVEGGDDRIAYCLVYYGKDGRLVTAFSGRKWRQRPAGCGNTVIAAPAPAAWRSGMEDLTRRVFDAVGFRGIGSLEFKVRGDGTLVIMEPTVGRTNWQSEIAVLNGVNIPAAAYCDALDLPHLAAPARVPPCKLIDGRAERRDLRDLLAGSDLTLSAWLAQRRGRKRYMLWRADDPGPAAAAVLNFCIRAFRYVLRQPGKLWRRVTRWVPGQG